MIVPPVGKWSIDRTAFLQSRCMKDAPVIRGARVPSSIKTALSQTSTVFAVHRLVLVYAAHPSFQRGTGAGVDTGRSMSDGWCNCAPSFGDDALRTFRRASRDRCAVARGPSSADTATCRLFVRPWTHALYRHAIKNHVRLHHRIHPPTKQARRCDDIARAVFISL